MKNEKGRWQHICWKIYKSNKPNAARRSREEGVTKEMSYGETREYLQSWVEKVHNNKTTLPFGI